MNRVIRYINTEKVYIHIGSKVRLKEKLLQACKCVRFFQWSVCISVWRSPQRQNFHFFLSLIRFFMPVFFSLPIRTPAIEVIWLSRFSDSQSLGLSSAPAELYTCFETLFIESFQATRFLKHDFYIHFLVAPYFIRLID